MFLYFIMIKCSVSLKLIILASLSTSNMHAHHLTAVYYLVFPTSLNGRSLWPAAHFYLRIAFNNKPLVYLFLDWLEFLAQYEKHLENVSKSLPLFQEKLWPHLPWKLEDFMKMHSTVFCSEPKIILKISCIPGIC